MFGKLNDFHILITFSRQRVVSIQWIALVSNRRWMVRLDDRWRCGRDLALESMNR